MCVYVYLHVCAGGEEKRYTNKKEAILCILRLGDGVFYRLT